MIKTVCHRPGLYVGRLDMREVRALLDGYAIALGEDGELEGDPFGGFLRWLEVRQDISHPAWGWDRILVHATGSHETAIRSLPEHFTRFCEEVAAGTFDPDIARERHFRHTSREPHQTCTEPWHNR